MRTTLLVILLAACSSGTQTQAQPTPTPTAAGSGDEDVIAGPIVPAHLQTGGGGGGGAPSQAAVTQWTDCPEGKGKTYEVGEDKKYESLGAVPFEQLGEGDRVLVHWRKEPYAEKVHISSSGSEKQPIRICGVPGPGGAPPVITGVNATTRKEARYPYEPTQERGLVIVTPRVGYRWGQKPKWIVIQGLELRGAYRGDDEQNPKTFTDAKGGKRAYSTNAAALFVERGEHITVRGCVLTDSAYGLFVASGGSEEVVSREILVEGSYIHGNGTTNVDRRHNVYTEAAGTVFQGNRFGPQRPGARGNQIKDRSAGTIVRYNWIEGGAHLLDLVEPEEAVSILGQDPRYHDTYVYGNVLVSGENDGSSMIHYGGDNGKTETYRKGTLYFHHNTVIVRADEQKRWATTIFRVETDDETVDARNNVFFREGTTHLSLMKQAGKLVLGTNWITDGYTPWQYPDRKTKGTSIAGEENLVKGVDPGFVDLAKNDLRLKKTAKASVSGTALAKDLDAAHVPTLQYLPHQATAPRARAGAGASLGAFEP